MLRSVNSLDKSSEKKFFFESIELYVKLLKAFAVKNKIKDGFKDKVITDETISKLIALTVIESDIEKDKIKLKGLLKNELYNEFISAVNFNIKYASKIEGLLNNIDPKIREIIYRKSQKFHKPKVVDFFCGAGGLSLGFVQAGFQIELANDHEDVCIETYKYNHPEVDQDKIIQGDIRKIVDHIEDYLTEEIDVVIGGPPCQGFSTANQQRIIDDPRNELYKYFIKAIKKIAPKFVVMENVRGMLPYAEQVAEDYKNIKIRKGKKSYSYLIGYKVMSSDDFGVAQKRQRLIFIGIRNDIAEKKKISPSDIYKIIDDNCKNITKHVLKDAIDYIKPLDAPRVKNLTEVDDVKTGSKIDINKYKGNENSYLKLINEGRTIPFVFNHKARYASDVNFEIYKRLNQGDDGTNEKILDIMPYTHRNHLFKDKYFKLIADKPSRTITAHLKMDCHSHIHPFQIRSITPREAARIQSFPDDYLFLGAYLKTYMQIGNAVPPVMARGIAKIIKKYI